MRTSAMDALLGPAYRNLKASGRVPAATVAQLDQYTPSRRIGKALIKYGAPIAVGGIAGAAVSAAGQRLGGDAMDSRGMGLTGFGVGAGGTSGVSAPSGGGILGTVLSLGEDFVRDRLLSRSDVPSPLVSQECGAGTIRVGNRCVSPGDAFPGGDPFVTKAGGASAGGGLASMLGGRTPTIVGSINGNPIRRCGRGWVLGIDDNCYHRKVLPRQFRKWAPSKKAKISAHDWKMMNKYGPGGAKQKKVKEIAQAAGFSCKKK